MYIMDKYTTKSESNACTGGDIYEIGDGNLEKINSFIPPKMRAIVDVPPITVEKNDCLRTAFDKAFVHIIVAEILKEKIEPR